MSQWTEEETAVGIDVCQRRKMYVWGAWDLQDKCEALFTRDKAMQMAYVLFFFTSVIFWPSMKEALREHNEPWTVMKTHFTVESFEDELQYTNKSVLFKAYERYVAFAFLIAQVHFCMQYI